jgi:hypothetical protein
MKSFGPRRETNRGGRAGRTLGDAMVMIGDLKLDRPQQSTTRESKKSLY